jgi:DNA-binding MarR family transcriptional regulator
MVYIRKQTERGNKKMRNEAIHQLMYDALELMPLLNKRFLREDELFKSEGLYPSHIQILLLLTNNKQMTMSEISREIHVINSNLTPLVDKLIKLNYLKRQPSKKDRRVVHISITTAGKKQVEKHRAYVEAMLSEKLENLSDEKVAELQHHVTEMLAIVNASFDA